MKTMKMKKIISTVVLAIMLIGTVTVLNSCGSEKVDSEFVGTWQLESITYAGQTVPTEPDMLTFEIKDNGKFTGEIEGTRGKGTWTEKDGVISMTDEANQTMTGNLVDGKMEMKISGADVVMKKK